MKKAKAGHCAGSFQILLPKLRNIELRQLVVERI